MLQLIDSVEAHKNLTGDYSNFGQDFTKYFQKLLLILGEINEAQAKLIQSRAQLPKNFSSSLFECLLFSEALCNINGIRSKLYNLSRHFKWQLTETFRSLQIGRSPEISDEASHTYYSRNWFGIWAWVSSEGSLIGAKFAINFTNFSTYSTTIHSHDLLLP